MDEPTPEENAEAIKAALFAGNKIEAIKLYRQQTKVGLAEAKSAVEQLEERWRKESPESFKTAKQQGCTVKLLLFAAIVAGLWRAFA